MPGLSDKNNVLPDVTDKYKDVDNFNFDTQNKNFDIKAFNTEFEQNQDQSITYNNIKEQDKLANFDKIEREKQLHNLSVIDHLVNMKNTFFDILYDVQSQPLTLTIFTKNNRLFYISLTLILVLFIYVFIIIFI